MMPLPPKLVEAVEEAESVVTAQWQKVTTGPAVNACGGLDQGTTAR